MNTENRGKELCEYLKSIRRQVALDNGIRYNPTPCNHQGDCSGTCPACEAELEYINQCLKEKSDHFLYNQIIIRDTEKQLIVWKTKVIEMIRNMLQQVLSGVKHLPVEGLCKMKLLTRLLLPKQRS